MPPPRPVSRITGLLGRTGLRRRSRLEDRLVWVVGSPRTGSTWLLNLLGWSTGAPMIDEPLIGAHLATTTADITGPRAEGAERTLVDIFADRPDYFFSEAHAGTWVPALRRLLLDRLGAGVDLGGSGPVLVKEPNGSRGTPTLLRCLPGSRILFLVRDGRDVVDSMYDGLAGGWIGENFGIDVDDLGGRRRLLASLADQWVRSMDAVQEAYDRHDARRRLVVRYEDLLADPVAELGSILDWVGQPAPERRIRHVVEELDVSRVPAEHRGTGKFVRAAQPGLWRQHLDDEESEVLERVMGPTLRRHGYDC